MNARFGSVREPSNGSFPRGSKRRSRIRAVIALTLAATFVTAVTNMSSASAAPSPNCSNPTTNRIEGMCIALKQIGKPYVFGGAGPSSFDCSGLVQYSFKKAGVKGVARVTTAQYAMYKTAAWRRVSSPSLGDLVFFNGYGHVGIYIGSGYVVHAPYPGKNVRKEAMKTIGSRSGYYLHLDS